MGMRRTLAFALMMVSACSSGSKPGRLEDESSGGHGGTGAAAGSHAGLGGTGGAQVGGGGTPGAQGGSNATGSSSLTLPRVYPPVRAATPTALIANPSYAAQRFQRAEPGGFGMARQAQSAGINLATAIQERFYSTGPTDLLRIVSS
jgi:hypothetical protein